MQGLIWYVGESSVRCLILLQKSWYPTTKTNTPYWYAFAWRNRELYNYITQGYVRILNFILVNQKSSLFECWSKTSIHTVRSVRVQTPHNRSQHIQANITRGFIQSVLLTMGIMMPETCWVNLLWINIYTCVICWFFLLLCLRQFITRRNSHPQSLTHYYIILWSWVHIST